MASTDAMNGILPRYCWHERIIMPATCAIDSMSRTPGITETPGKWPWKNGSFTVTFLMPTARLPGSSSTTLSTRRNGYRCGNTVRIRSLPSESIIFSPRIGLSARGGDLLRQCGVDSVSWPQRGYAYRQASIQQRKVADQVQRFVGAPLLRNPQRRGKRVGRLDHERVVERSTLCETRRYQHIDLAPEGERSRRRDSLHIVCRHSGRPVDLQCRRAFGPLVEPGLHPQAHGAGRLRAQLGAAVLHAQGRIQSYEPRGRALADDAGHVNQPYERLRAAVQNRDFGALDVDIAVVDAAACQSRQQMLDRAQPRAIAAESGGAPRIDHELRPRGNALAGGVEHAARPRPGRPHDHTRGPSGMDADALKLERRGESLLLHCYPTGPTSCGASSSPSNAPRSRSSGIMGTPGSPDACAWASAGPRSDPASRAANRSSSARSRFRASGSLAAAASSRIFSACGRAGYPETVTPAATSPITPPCAPTLAPSPSATWSLMPAWPPSTTPFPTDTLPATPTCATMRQPMPTDTLCAMCTRLSILVPAPTRVIPVFERSMQVFAPTSTSSPISTVPRCGTFIARCPT